MLGHTAASVCLLLLTTPASSRDDNEIPTVLRGTWVLRLYSDDGGMSNKSGDNARLCEVSSKEVRFLKKMNFSDEKLAVKSVRSIGQGDDAGHAVYFANGSVWRILKIGNSINVMVGREQRGRFRESFRMTVDRE
jgi:hypothetical protein